MNLPIKSTVLSVVIASVFILSGCEKTNPSGAMKRALKKNGGNWEVSQTDEYHMAIGYDYLFSKDMGSQGEYFFGDEDPPAIAGNLGTRTPVGGLDTIILYQVSDIQDNLTMTIYDYHNNTTENHKGYEVLDGWTKEEIVMVTSSTVYGAGSGSYDDTIVRHIVTIRNLGY